jgi:DNA-binding transcriptional regulator LsrR (DeoR family)
MMGVPLLKQDALRTDERLLALVARLYFVENKSQRAIKDDPEVLALYKAISQATVNRLLHRARESGVVSISIDASFAVKAGREPQLSRRMRDGFHLQECFALRPEGEADAAGDDSPNEANEDRLILSIVNFTAEEISNALNPSDHVLCAGGRTICWLARAVRRDPPSKRGLIFTPLSGRLWVEDFKTGDADIMERPLDADDAVHIFAEAFEDEPGGQFSQINQPLYCTGKTSEEAARNARLILSTHCAIGVGDSWNWGLPDAKRALVGVGSLESNSHRLAIYLRKLEADPESLKGTYLQAAVPNLIEINRLCKQADLPLPGDMGNRLFPCLPLPSALKKLGTRGEHLHRLGGALHDIAGQIEELNAKAVVLTWNHLRRTPHARVICAGRSKRGALWTVLLAAYFDGEKGATPLVKELSTDQKTADQLLSELTTMQADPELRAWYEEQLATFGLLAADPATGRLTPHEEAGEPKRQ